MDPPDINIVMRRAEITKFELAEQMGIPERAVRQLCNCQLPDGQYNAMMSAIKAIIAERHTTRGCSNIQWLII